VLRPDSNNLQLISYLTASSGVWAPETVGPIDTIWASGMFWAKTAHSSAAWRVWTIIFLEYLFVGISHCFTKGESKFGSHGAYRPTNFAIALGFADDSFSFNNWLYRVSIFVWGTPEQTFNCDSIIAGIHNRNVVPRCEPRCYCHVPLLTYH